MISEWINLEIVEDFIVDLSFHFLMTVQLHNFTLGQSVKQKWKVNESEVNIHIALIWIILLNFLDQPFSIVLLNIHLVVYFIIVELSEVYLIMEVSLGISIVKYVYDLDYLLNVLIIKINSLHRLGLCFRFRIWIESFSNCILELSQYGCKTLLT